MRSTTISFRLCTILLILSFSAIASADSATVERHVWNKEPIAIQINVGDERRVQFRAPVSVGVPAALQDTLRVQTVNGTVYLMSNRAFPKTRLLIRELDGGQVYLIDLMCVDEVGSMPPIAVHFPDTGPAARTRVQATSPPGYVSLSRFAAQQLYAPERLIEAMPGMHRVALQLQSVSLLPSSSVEATPLMAWRAGNLYITAVKLRNLSKRPQVLDPRTLRGNWLSATFQHARLLPSGSDADTTAVYLVSAQSFAASF